MEHLFQQQLLNHILKMAHKRSEGISEMAKILNKRKDGIYRRLKGETVLSVNELYDIAHAYKFSVDQFTGPATDQFLFSFNMNPERVESGEDFLSMLDLELETIKYSEKKHIFYATQDIPFFIHLFYPELTHFKFYIYSMSSWNVSQDQSSKFSLDLMPSYLENKARRLAMKYAAIPSTDLWMVSLLDVTLNQIAILVEMGKFEKPMESILICDQLLSMVDHMRAMASVGKKIPPGKVESNQSYGSLELFVNEIATTSTTVMVNDDTGKSLFLALCQPCFVKSTNPVVCNQMEAWLNSLVNNSICISVHGNARRNWFFNQLEKKVLATKRIIEHHL